MSLFLLIQLLLMDNKLHLDYYLHIKLIISILWQGIYISQNYHVIGDTNILYICRLY